MVEEITRRDFLKKTTAGLAGLAAGLYLLDGCRLREDISSIYRVEEIGDKKYLVIDGVPKVYELEKVEVFKGDGYDSLIFRGIEDYNRMSSDNECRLPQILKDLNGGELIAGRDALGPTEVLTEEEFQELVEKYKKD